MMSILVNRTKGPDTEGINSIHSQFSGMHAISQASHQQDIWKDSEQGANVGLDSKANPL